MKKNLKPIIGILGFPTHDCNDNSVIAVSNYYKNAIVKNNGIPHMICPLLDIDYFTVKNSNIPDITEDEKKTYKSIVDMCDGIIIPGGNKIYNFDKFVAEYAIYKNKPVLGICMGMQLLANIDNNSYCLEANDTLINHDTNENNAHKVSIVDNTLLSSIINEKEISVNSLHNYHVTNTKEFIVSAYSEDGLIEGIELPTRRFVLGVQWHPEKMPDDKYANKIFSRFIDECNKYNNK